MKIDTISSPGAGQHNEDLVAVFRHGDHAGAVTDLLVIDGGTSVAERDYIDPEAGDVVWFVQGFCRELEASLQGGRSQRDCVMLALAAMRASLGARCAPGTVPAYAMPIAALTWVRVTPGPGGFGVGGYCLGDCKALLCLADASRERDEGVIDLDPYVNPQELILQDAIAALGAQGIDDPAARKQRLLPMLRERRAYLNALPAPTILSLAACGTPAARTFARSVAPGSALLLMTDGLYRMVEPYALQTAPELARDCLARGLAPVLGALRDYEKAHLGSASTSVKRADDAAAILCALDDQGKD